MVQHYRPRLLGSYLSQTKQLLGPVKKLLLKSHPIGISTDPSWSMVSRFCLDCLKFKAGPANDEGLGELVCRAYELRNVANGKEQLLSILPTNKSNKVWAQIRFLGRLKSAFECFVETATALGSFANLKIHAIPVDKKRFKAPSNMPSLAKTMAQLGLDVTPQILEKHVVRRHRGKRPTVSVISEEFQDRQRRDGFIHAEVQILLYLMRNSLNLSLKYIGCSRRSCFLCKTLLERFKPPYTTRHCHGKLYYKWIIPDQLVNDSTQRQSFVEPIRQLVDVLRFELLRPISSPMPHVPESSASVTVVSKRPRSQPNNIMLLRSMLGYQDSAAQLIGQDQRPARSQRLMKSETSYSARPSAGISGATRKKKLPQKQDSFPSTADLSETLPVIYTEQLVGDCSVCQQSTSRKCSKCSADFFCSTRCEDKAWVGHRMGCASPLTTADHLEYTCLYGEVPCDEQTLEDYGFTHLLRNNDRKKLLGLYIGLLAHLNISAAELNGWLEDGFVYSGIIRAFQQIPAPIRGEYFSWFLKHLPLIMREKDTAINEQMEKLNKLVRTYLATEDRGREIEDLQPLAKRDSFMLLRTCLLDYHPSPKEQASLYYSFGFVVCTKQREVNELGIFYTRLLRNDKRSGLESFMTDVFPVAPVNLFSRLWKALDSGSLISFFRAQCFYLEFQRLEIPHLEEFLSNPTNRPSVWDLSLFLNQTTFDPPNIVCLEYGFIHCDTFEKKRLLKERYAEVLKKADPLDLHNACMEGKLFDFCSRHTNLSNDYRRLMNNLYPLASHFIMA